jgi:hypothetical protein
MSLQDANETKKSKIDEPLFEDVNVEDGNAVDLASGQARGFENAQHKEDWKKAIKESPKALLWCECFLG